jgi:hypothetical protein
MNKKAEEKAVEKPTPETIADPAVGEDGEAYSAEYWQKVLDGIGEEGQFMFLKKAKTRIRLVMPDKGSRKPFRTVTSIYRGKPRTKYMMLAVDMDADEGFQVRGMVAGKRAYKAIVSFLAEGYDLFNPTKGYGLTLIKTGTGPDTSYTAIPSHKPVPLPDEILNADLPDLDKVASEFDKWQVERNAQPQQSSSRRRSGQGRRRRPPAEEDEVEDEGEGPWEDDEDPF